MCTQMCTDVYVHTRTRSTVLLERLEMVLLVCQLWWGSVVLHQAKSMSITKQLSSTINGLDEGFRYSLFS